MKWLRRTCRMQSTKYSSSRGAARARWPLKMTRSKQESTEAIRRINLVTKRDSVFMASSSGRGLGQTPFWQEDAVLLTYLVAAMPRWGAPENKLTVSDYNIGLPASWSLLHG